MLCRRGARLSREGRRTPLVRSARTEARRELRELHLPLAVQVRQDRRPVAAGDRLSHRGCGSDRLRRHEPATLPFAAQISVVPNQCSLPQVIASDSWKASNRMPVAFTASSEAK
jgi:hypothetical protein